MVTFINVFTVDAVDQQRLIDLLTTVTEGPVSRAAGFVSATLHRGTDGTKVAVYARWQSLADYQAMRGDPEQQRCFEEILAIATFEPGAYEVIRTFTPPEP
ncbi:antibiotic biosynthesis monooxygenase family protein [Ancylobacter mangrovi]|uniref:Antibiotic biosynthesis monooxygenase n=1 Tax=Ancylobacter mangrovi TaxID=2972472 RepID=A0A9X2PGW9_9HYPH|nr:antibiotic biosynthesis monooxygenase [Ancylobacter mangrovi]MCS0496846.1 antibiotic biosynthesis monooxygenase [Ancylobacter mangrovi]MCS0504807.1 antibiotic biosynthesis monooxygenase [Ancylobacter mangrovi]